MDSGSWFGGKARILAPLLSAMFASLLFACAQPSTLAPAASASPAYTSAEAAFLAAFVASGIAQRGYSENREYAAAIYEMPDGRWHATDVVPGDRTSSQIPYHAVPVEATRIVGAHTHGQPHVPDDPNAVYGTYFSLPDLRNAFHNYEASNGRIVAQLLITSELRVLRLTIDHAAVTGDVTIAQADDLVGRSEAIGEIRLPGVFLAAKSEVEAGPAAKVITRTSLAQRVLHLQ